MVKKVQDTDSDQSMTSAPQEGKSFDLYIVQYIIRALMMLIVFAWALVNLDAVLRFLNSVFALVSPFLIGGGDCVFDEYHASAVRTPLEACVPKSTAKRPDRCA